MKELTVQELKALVDAGEAIQIVDVREDWEREMANIPHDYHIPLDEIEDRLEEVEQDKKVIFYCRAGIRSASALNIVEENEGLENLYNLTGGIIAWAEEIDPDMTTY